MKHKSILALLISQALLANVLAQQPSPRPPAQSGEDVVKITTNLVQVDAAVTDKKGRPITDLKAEDFEVYEDGRLQKITNFSFISAELNTPSSVVRSNADAPRTKRVDEPPVPTIRLRPENVVRTVALVVDDLGLSFESMHFVRDALRKFVDEQMQPGDLVAIIRTGAGVGALQQFTSDKRLLYAAIDRAKWNGRGRAGIPAFAPIEDSPLVAANMRPSADGPVAPTNPLERADMERDVKKQLAEFKDEIFSVGTLGALNYIISGLRNLPGAKFHFLFSCPA